MPDGEMKIATVVTGDRAVKERFKAFEGSTRSRIRSALNGLGLTIRSRAQSNAPRGKTGRLAGSIKESVTDVRNTTTVKVSVGKYYGRFTESGVAAYGTARNKRATRRRSRQAVQERLALTRAGHWRIEPKHWFQRALDSVEPTIRPVIERAITQSLDDVR